MNKSIKYLQLIKVNDEYETRNIDLLEGIRKYKIYPEIDVFATIKNKKFSTYFTKKNSAFKYSLTVDSYANPPYSKIYDCMKYLYGQYLKNNINIMILTYNKTDTDWWHKFVEDKAEVHFIKGRLKFLLNGLFIKRCVRCQLKFVDKKIYCPTCKYKLAKTVAPYPNCWIIYRKKKVKDKISSFYFHN